MNIKMERINPPERLEKEVKFYIMFVNNGERNRAKDIINQMLSEDKEGGIYQLPAGPDYPITKVDILGADFAEFHDDENPEKRDVGLEVSFRHTPSFFPSPEALESFILEQLNSRGLKLSKKDGHTEIYEVVGGESVEYRPD